MLLSKLTVSSPLDGRATAAYNLVKADSPTSKKKSMIRRPSARLSNDDDDDENVDPNLFSLGRRSLNFTAAPLMSSSYYKLTSIFEESKTKAKKTTIDVRNAKRMYDSKENEKQKDRKQNTLQMESVFPDENFDSYDDDHDDDNNNDDDFAGFQSILPLESDALHSPDASVFPEHSTVDIPNLLVDLVDAFPLDAVRHNAPCQTPTVSLLAAACPTWTAMIKHFAEAGKASPVVWRSTASCGALTAAVAGGSEEGEEEIEEVEEGDEAEWSLAFDFHSIITSRVPVTEDLASADQVIQDIHDFLEDEDDDEDNEQILLIEEPNENDSASTTDFTNDDQHYSPSLSRRPATPTLSELQRLVETLDRRVRENSELLVAELAVRDRLEEERDVKDQFISILVEVQDKRRRSRKKEVERRASLTSAATSSLSLNINRRRSAMPSTPATSPSASAVIPYDAETPIDVPLLRVFVEILKAIRDESPKVPSLLTDYILRVLCPGNGTSGESYLVDL